MLRQATAAAGVPAAGAVKIRGMKSVLAVAAVILLAGVAHAVDIDPAWPAVTRECRPGAYWWWMGSAVDTENIAKELQRYKDCGIGGVHVIPIYGAKGAGTRYLQYLGSDWMKAFSFAVQEARRLDLNVDMTTGTGWCFGGPTVSEEQAGRSVECQRVPFPADGRAALDGKGMRWEAVLAEAPDGRLVDITDKLKNGRIDFMPPAKGWFLCTLGSHRTGIKVKRAAPGGEGWMLNPFYGQAMHDYLPRFTEAFAQAGIEKPRAMYHDSWEYVGNWSPDFLAEFSKRRGYRLQDQLPALAGAGPADRVMQVLHDYRETASDMVIENSFPQWVQWCHDRGMLVRLQAHGSPANLLDFYALADIPETEMFGRGTRDPLQSGMDAHFSEGARDQLVSKFASSAGHVAGRKLVSSETGTWMAEHFCETLEEMKCLVDRMFVSGINHVYYHGCCYSPDDAAWPGWVFYAATEMNPRNPIWHDAPALNAYIARCQSILQSGTPDNNVLLYWPIHDLWQGGQPGEQPSLQNCAVSPADWVTQQPVGVVAKQLWNHGYAFDYISDRQLAGVQVQGDALVAPGGSMYRVVLVPPTQFMPEATLKQLVKLSEAGATVIFADHLPAGVPGLGALGERQTVFKAMLLRLSPGAIGKGRVLVGNLETILQSAKVPREMLADHEGAAFIRRRHEGGRYYFIANQSMKPMDGWFTLGTPAKSVVMMDAMTARTGMGQLKADTGGGGQVYLHVRPGHSIILKTYETNPMAGAKWDDAEPGRVTSDLKGPWQVNFTEGGPVPPKPFETSQLVSWTNNGDDDAQRFSGTAVYHTTFDAPAGTGPWILDLGRVCNSARVRLNGKALGTLIMQPYQMDLNELKPAGNVLEVEVTNLGANRIRDMDRRKVPWKIFHDINVVNINYKPFDASSWPVFDSGLIGPVVLRGHKEK
jgi:hypothetical protein